MAIITSRNSPIHCWGRNSASGCSRLGPSKRLEPPKSAPEAIRNEIFLLSRRVAGAQARQDRLEQLRNALLDRMHARVEPDRRVLGRFIGRGDSGETGNLAGPGFAIEPSRIAALANGEIRRQIDFKETLGTENASRQSSVLAIRGNERRDQHHSGVVEKPGHLGNPAYVLLAIFRRETEVATQAVADIVPVQHEIRMS